MNKHTPPPWEVVARTDGKYVLTIGGKGDMHISYWPCPISLEERRANVDLMAAAPLLLEALEAAIAELRRLRCVHLPRFEGKIGEPDLGVLQAARAAIARAKGVSLIPGEAT